MPQDLIGCWNQRKLKALIPRVVVFANDPMVGKYALTCAMEIQKILIVARIFSGFALFTELM